MNRIPFCSVKTNLTVKFKGQSVLLTLRLYFRGNMAPGADSKMNLAPPFFGANHFAGTEIITAARNPNTHKTPGRPKKHILLRTPARVKVTSYLFVHLDVEPVGHFVVLRRKAQETEARLASHIDSFTLDSDSSSLCFLMTATTTGEEVGQSAAVRQRKFASVCVHDEGISSVCRRGVRVSFVRE